MNPVSLYDFGYDARYTLYPCGKVYDSSKNEFCNIYDNTKCSLKSLDGEFKTVSIRTLYKKVYNKLYIKDDIKDLDNEVWKDISVIKKYEHLRGMYEVSNMGRIKSYHEYNTKLIGFDADKGYRKIDLEGKQVLISRLVLMAFCPTDDETLEADHKNFDVSDNRLVNLQWLSKKENIARSWERRNQNKEKQHERD